MNPEASIDKPDSDWWITLIAAFHSLHLGSPVTATAAVAADEAVQQQKISVTPCDGFAGSGVS